MRPTTREDVLKRLSYIEGHLAGIRRMIDEDKYCVDILKQTYAVRRAIEKLEGLLSGYAAELRERVRPLRVEHPHDRLTVRAVLALHGDGVAELRGHVAVPVVAPLLQGVLRVLDCHRAELARELSLEWVLEGEARY